MVLAKIGRARWLRKHLDAEGLKRLSTPDTLGVAV
jgi:hypothetical protein